MSDGEYYILKCPYCDKNITKVLEYPHSIVHCPECDRELYLYSVFGYNMWLSEQGKSKKVKRRPIRDVKQYEHTDYIDMSYDEDGYDFDEEQIMEQYINSSSLMQKRPEALHELLSFNTDVCLMQFRYLTRVGFTREEAIELIKELIKTDFIL